MLSGFNFPDFSSAAGLNVLGSAVITADNRLRLTRSDNDLGPGAAWYNADKPLVAGNFETTFQFQLAGGPQGTDTKGFALVIQNDDPAIFGGGAEKLGYEGIWNSVAVEFDTEVSSDENDPSQSHISVHTNSTGPNLAHESYSLGSYNTVGLMDDGQVHTAKVNYAPGTLKIYLDNLSMPVLTVPLDMNATLDLDNGRAWVGFTSAPDVPSQNQDILNWSFQGDDNLVIADKPSVIEGATGSTTPATFTVSRLGSLAGQAVVNWSTANGTALAGTDYMAASGQVTFADGESQKTVAITVNGDTAVEPHEKFKLALSTAAPYTAVAGQATIANDETAVSISDNAVSEGESGYRFSDAFVQARGGGLYHGRSVVFGPDGNAYVSHLGFGGILRYDGQTGQFIDLFADARNVAGGAIQIMFHQSYLFVGTGSDVLRFDATTGAPMPAPGKTESRFATPHDQGIDRGAHSLAFGPDGNLYLTSEWTNEVLKYDGSSGAFLGTYVAAGSGGLNTPLGITFGPDGHLYVGSNGNNSVLRFQGPLEANPGAFLDTFVTPGSGGLAWVPAGGLQFGADGSLYVSSRDTSSVLRFNGSTGAFLQTVVSSGEGGLSSAGGFSFDSAGRLYVNSQYTHEVLRYVPATQAVFAVTLSSPSALPVTVSYATANGSAAAGSDYVQSSGTVTFPAGVTRRMIFVDTLDDTAGEPAETFTANLSNPSAGATVADSQGVATISANDEKFYVVNDASPDRTYEYGATGTAVENYTLSSGNTAPRGAASSAAGTTVWVVDANKSVYLYNASGALQGSWAAGGLPNGAQVEGIATNGTDVWLVDNKSDKVFTYTGAASRTSGSQTAASSFALNSGNSNAKDIVTDGTSFWVVNDSTTDKVFKYTVAGSLLGSWTIGSANAQPTGLTLDPVSPSTIWIVDAGADKVFQYNNAAGLTSGSRTPDASWTLAAGNTNPQGIADPPVTGGQVARATGPSALDAYFAWLGREEGMGTGKRKK